jgi:hypothetical protein
MPAYDNMAIVYRRGTDWFVRERTRDGMSDEQPLTLNALRQMVELLRAHHAEAG